jgi:hypothetical protein
VCVLVRCGSNSKVGLNGIGIVGGRAARPAIPRQRAKVDLGPCLQTERRTDLSENALFFSGLPPTLVEDRGRAPSRETPAKGLHFRTNVLRSPNTLKCRDFGAGRFPSRKPGFLRGGLVIVGRSSRRHGPISARSSISGRRFGRHLSAVPVSFPGGAPRRVRPASGRPPPACCSGPSKSAPHHGGRQGRDGR